MSEQTFFYTLLTIFTVFMAYAVNDIINAFSGVIP